MDRVKRPLRTSAADVAVARRADFHAPDFCTAKFIDIIEGVVPEVTSQIV